MSIKDNNFNGYIGNIDYYNYVLNKKDVKNAYKNKLKDNLTPASAMMYGFSTIVCVPTSRAQEVGLCLGAQAGPKRLIKVLEDAGFEGVRISESTTNNLVFEAAK